MTKFVRLIDHGLKERRRWKQVSGVVGVYSERRSAGELVLAGKLSGSVGVCISAILRVSDMPPLCVDLRSPASQSRTRNVALLSASTPNIGHEIALYERIACPSLFPVYSLSVASPSPVPLNLIVPFPIRASPPFSSFAQRHTVPPAVQAHHDNSLLPTLLVA
jgi:hypothetical protein